MSAFLEYVPGASPLHRMNPVAKLGAAALFAIACFCSSNLVFLAVLLVAAFTLAASCGMVRQTLGLAKAVFAFSLILALVQVLTTPSGAVLVVLPWGYIGTGGLLAALTTVVRLVAAAIPLFLVFYVTKMNDITNAVVKVLHVPYKYAFTFTSTTVSYTHLDVYKRQHQRCGADVLVHQQFHGLGHGGVGGQREHVALHDGLKHRAARVVLILRGGVARAVLHQEHHHDKADEAQHARQRKRHVNAENARLGGRHHA